MTPSVRAPRSRGYRFDTRSGASRRPIAADVVAEGRQASNAAIPAAASTQLIAEGLHLEGIAQKLVISVKTAERHSQNILDKLGMNDRSSSRGTRSAAA